MDYSELIVYPVCKLVGDNLSYLPILARNQEEAEIHLRILANGKVFTIENYFEELRKDGTKF